MLEYLILSYFYSSSVGLRFLNLNVLLDVLWELVLDYRFVLLVRYPSLRNEVINEVGQAHEERVVH